MDMNSKKQYLQDLQSEYLKSGKKEKSLLLKGEKQIYEGDFVWWRDIKRTDV